MKSLVILTVAIGLSTSPVSAQLCDDHTVILKQESETLEIAKCAITARKFAKSRAEYNYFRALLMESFTPESIGDAFRVLFLHYDQEVQVWVSRGYSMDQINGLYESQYITMCAQKWLTARDIGPQENGLYAIY